MSHRIVTIDAFTSRPFTGNPCAIVPEADGLSDEQMQSIAREANQPETSFVMSSQRADFRVCYFTTTKRIPFAGHPTIATAFLLALDGRIAPPSGRGSGVAGASAAGVPAGGTRSTRVEFEFDIGVLPVEVEFGPEDRPVRAIMSQPRPSFGAQLTAGELAEGFTLAAEDFLPGFPAQVVSTGVPFLIAPVRGLDVLKRVEMERPALRRILERVQAAAVFMFALGGFAPEADTHARLLDPDGSMEDPFTGSASGCMGAYIVRHGLKPGPTFRLEQGHLVGRPGQGLLEILGDSKAISGIKLSGSAVKTTEGTILLGSEDT
jgi:trans-2,3-dihydro-3-hydroxyanthranilate isomerase